MGYPQINRHLQYTKLEDNSYEVVDILSGDVWIASKFIVRLLKCLEKEYPLAKTFPEHSKEELREALLELKEAGLLGRKKRLHILGLGNILITIWQPRSSGKRRAGIWNYLLMFLFLPVCLSSWILLPNIMDWSVSQGTLLEPLDIYVLILGIVLSLISHEIAHMNAAIAYKVKVYEMGVGLSGFLPSAYTLMDDRKMKNWKKRVQINLAGIEANMLLSGICIYLIVLFPEIFLTLYCLAIVNLLFAVINLFFGAGLDGMHVLEDIWAVSYTHLTLPTIA